MTISLNKTEHRDIEMLFANLFRNKPKEYFP